MIITLKTVNKAALSALDDALYNNEIKEKEAIIMACRRLAQADTKSLAEEFGADEKDAKRSQMGYAAAAKAFDGTESAENALEEFGAKIWKDGDYTIINDSEGDGFPALIALWQDENNLKWAFTREQQNPNESGYLPR